MSERTALEPSGRTHGPWGDVALALIVGAVQIVATFFAGHNQPERTAFDAGAFALLGLGPAALLLRRRYPLAVLAATFAATLAYWLADYPRGPIFLALIVAYYTAEMAGLRLVARLSLIVGYASFLWLGYLLGVEPPPTLGQAIGLAAWLLVLLSVAEVVRVRRERALEAERTREEEMRRRAGEERMRIARELHDVLAHNISLINVQAGVALHLMDERPEQARTALAAIKQASKDALRETRSVLGVLRQVDEEEPRAPAPGLARLDDLVSGATATGLSVRTEIEGMPRRVPGEIDQAAYRIIQEALTNVTRHAGAASATVRVAYGDRDLVVQVDDDGPGTDARGASDSNPGGGHGIRGMRERAAAMGGELEAGPRGDGAGFRVRARLPLDGAT